MATPARYYTSTAVQTSLTGTITPSDTSISVAATTGFPGTTPFTLSLDYGQSNEELVDVTVIAGLNLTVTRAVDGTPASAHNAGAVVRHVSSARDFTESRAHEIATTNTHGITGVGNDFVGTTSTQSLSNKTLVRATGTLANIDIFNTGSWTTAIIGDSTNPSFPRLSILDNEVALNIMTSIRSNGALFMFKAVGESDSSYRFRMTDSNTSTDRFALLAGGTTTITPTATTTFVANDIVAPDTSTTKRAIRIAAAGGATERFTVWNDGHVDVTGTSTSTPLFDITGPAAHASSFLRVLNSGATALVDVDSTGRVNARYNLDAEAVNGGANVPLRVFANNPGPQTAALTQWVDSSNAVVAQIDPNGDPSFGTTVWTAFTPVWTNTPATSTNVGWYKKLGKIVFFEIYSVFSALGTTSNTVQGNLPSVPFRDGNGANTTRQLAASGWVAGAYATNSGVSGVAMAQVLATGSGTAFTVSDFQNVPVHDNHWQSGTIVTFQGWYREA
jgi:hypothetical protein